MGKVDKFTPTMEEVIEWAGDFNDYLRVKFLKGFSHPTYKNVVHAKCVECSGYDGMDGIRNCTVKRCPLRQYRPYKTKDE